jgi:NhaP-type Na+/H+ or K+/H+ antiporter
MTGFEHALLLILLLAGLSVAGRWLPWPMPITHVLGATVAAWWLGFPRIELDPGFFFLCFVPPLLFSDGWLMPLRDFMAAKRPILTLATGLVVFTTLAVGLVAHWLVPGLPLAMAFALGAVVSPTDAVAVSAITQRLKVPARLTTVLNGESLMNDATGLVAFKFALGAAIAGAFSLQAAAMDFVILAAGGTVVGLALSWLVGRLRDLLRQDAQHGRVHRGHAVAAHPVCRLPRRQRPRTFLHPGRRGRRPLRRLARSGEDGRGNSPDYLGRVVGDAVLAQRPRLRAARPPVPDLLTSISGQYSLAQLGLFTAVVSAVAILARLVWIFPGAYLPFVLFKRFLRGETPPSWQSVTVAGWAGMRGTITLAAALSIPQLMADGSPFPGRDIVIFLSFGVVMVTLLLQGISDLRAEIGDGALQAFLERHPRLPPRTFFASVMSGPALLRVIGGQRLVHDLGLAAHQFERELGQLQHRELARIPMFTGPTVSVWLIRRRKPSIKSST